jgi:hypothetical protein
MQLSFDGLEVTPNLTAAARSNKKKSVAHRTESTPHAALHRTALGHACAVAGLYSRAATVLTVRVSLRRPHSQLAPDASSAASAAAAAAPSAASAAAAPNLLERLAQGGGKRAKHDNNNNSSKKKKGNAGPPSFASAAAAAGAAAASKAEKVMKAEYKERLAKYKEVQGTLHGKAAIKATNNSALKKEMRLSDKAKMSEMAKTQSQSWRLPQFPSLICACYDPAHCVAFRFLLFDCLATMRRPLPVPRFSCPLRRAAWKWPTLLTAKPEVVALSAAVRACRRGAFVRIN